MLHSSKSYRKEEHCLSVAEALQVMFAFGDFNIGLLTLVVALIVMGKQK